MPDTNRVLTALRNELVTAGIVRRPDTAGALPPLFIEPGGGAPAPGEREGTEAGTDLTVTIRLSSTAPARAGAAGRRTDVVDFIYRSQGTGGLRRGREVDAAIRRRLVETASYGTGVMLDYGGPAPVFALEVFVFGGLSPLDDSGGVRTDLAKYALEVIAAP